MAADYEEILKGKEFAMAGKVTIQDIADALGLSRNTVSKAINNTGVLADATRDRILRKAVEMGYKQFSYVRFPLEGNKTAEGNQSTGGNPALSLAQEQGTLGEHRGVVSLLTAHNLGDSHFASTMLDRLQRELTAAGYSFMIHRVSPEDIERNQLPASFQLCSSDAILCIELFHMDYALMVCGLGKPTLFVDGPSAFVSQKLPADLLLMDNRTEIMTFVRQMAEAGFRRFAFAGDFHHCISFYERYQALREALFQAGIPFDPEYCVSPTAEAVRSSNSHDAFLDCFIERLPQLDPFPQVLLCANDFVAMDVMSVIKEKGCRIPDDIRICGFDDSPESRVLSPSLTTVHIHSQIMGYTAASLLLSRISEPSLQYRTVHTETSLILRDSARP